jgi:hypothetical protein
MRCSATILPASADGRILVDPAALADPNRPLAELLKAKASGVA